MSLLISILCIYLALLIQFKNAIKPLLVFAAIPFGVGAALLCLGLMNTPFGFMAFSIVSNSSATRYPQPCAGPLAKTRQPQPPAFPV